MSIVGLGVDITPVSRIREMVEHHGDRFLERCFTPGERAYCDTQARRRFECLAARFAAKEAALKALGTGWRSGIAWTDVEVVHQPSGAPSLNVTGEAGAIAQTRSMTAWMVSISHTAEYAVASVLALREEPPSASDT